MTPEELSLLIRSCLDNALAQGKLPLTPADLPETVRVERPRSREHGDWSANTALQLAKKAGMNPRDLAEIIAAGLRGHTGVKKAEVAGPGFVNITLDAGAAGELARTIVEAGEKYGNSESGADGHVNLELSLIHI